MRKEKETKINAFDAKVSKTTLITVKSAEGHLCVVVVVDVELVVVG